MSTTEENTPDDADGLIKQKMSDELGFDVTFVEQQVRFRLDLIHMKQGEPAQMGYLLMNRDHHTDVAMVFDTPAEAKRAMESHPLVDALVEEDCIDLDVPLQTRLQDIANREIILP